MSIDRKSERLHAIALFAGADKAHLSDLASRIDSTEVAAGYVLIRQGSAHHEAFVIESGTAEVLVDDEPVAELGEGELVGEIGMLAGGRASATVIAKTRLSLLVIPHQQFDAVLDDSPGMARIIARELAQRLRDTDARLH